MGSSCCHFNETHSWLTEPSALSGTGVIPTIGCATSVVGLPSSTLMKKSSFCWQAGNARPLPDQQMTRERAASLLRNWRRSRPFGRPVYSLKRVRDCGVRGYLLRHLASGESCALYVLPDAASTVVPAALSDHALAAGRRGMFDALQDALRWHRSFTWLDLQVEEPAPRYRQVAHVAAGCGCVEHDCDPSVHENRFNMVAA